MNNLLSYCGLTDARMRASEKDLPVALNSINSQVFSFDMEFFGNTCISRGAFIYYVKCGGGSESANFPLL